MPTQLKKKKDPQHESPTWNVTKAPDGILCNPMLSRPLMIHQAPPPMSTHSHQILGGIILGSGHNNLAHNLNFRPHAMGQSSSPYRQAKFSKSTYVGVTSRPSRDKYQARIYKGSREYNLGMYDVAADAALGFDITHRLMNEVLSSGGDEFKNDNIFTDSRVQAAISKLDEMEKDSNIYSPALSWLDNTSIDGDDSKPSSVKDSESLNFNKPEEYHVAREKEIKGRKLEVCNNTGEDKKGTYPELAHLKVLIRKEAIRVAKFVIATSAGIVLDDDTKKRKRKDGESSPNMHRPNLNYNTAIGGNAAIAQMHTNPNDTNTAPVNSVHKYGMAGGMQYGTYAQMGGTNPYNQSGYAQNYNPMMIQQGGMAPMGGAIQVLPGYGMMPNMNRQSEGQMGGPHSGNATMVLSAAEEARVASTYGHSIESIDQRMAVLRQQKQQLERMLMGQTGAAPAAVGHSGKPGTNPYQNAGAAHGAVQIQFINQAPGTYKPSATTR